MTPIQFPDFYNQIKYSHKIKNKLDVDFHSHQKFIIHLFISGDVNYFVEKKVYHLKYGDLLVIQSSEFHKYSVRSGTQHEIITVGFDPEIIRGLNLPAPDLLHCFTKRIKGKGNRVHLNEHQINSILQVFHKFEELNTFSDTEGPVLKLAYLMELLVLVNKYFSSALPVEEHSNVPEKLQPVLDYIEDNLQKDLTLGKLGQKFYLNPSYLSVLFRKSTGVNINEYIIFKRITKAKDYLTKGYNVTDVCHMVGFNDYSNFIRRFKQVVGQPPGQYKKNVLSR